MKPKLKRTFRIKKLSYSQPHVIAIDVHEELELEESTKTSTYVHRPTSTLIYFFSHRPEIRSEAETQLNPI